MINNEKARQYIKAAVILSVLSVGLVLSLAGYPMAFQRSGALLVAIAIGLGAVDLGSTLGDVLPNERIEMFRSMKFNMERRDPPATKAEHLALDNAMRIEIIFNQDSIRRRLLRNDGWLAIIGTLIWGFGDLPFPA